MGFGYGRITSHNESAAYRYSDGARVKMVMSSDMVAHVWNSQSQDFGRISNGNFYFRARQIFSYGSHYLVGMIMPDGVALINAERNSITTNGHVSDAGAASRNRTRYWIDDLTALDSWLSSVACTLENLRGTQYGTKEKAGFRADMRKRALRELAEHADKLQAVGTLPDTSSERWSPAVENGIQAGEYIAKLCGLTAQSWERAKRIKNQAIEKAAKIKAAKEKANALHNAETLATQTDSAFRENCRHWLKNYGEHYIAQTAKEYFRARKVGKASGFSKKKLATLLARERHLRRILADVETAKRIAKQRAELVTDIQWIRGLGEQLSQRYFTKPMSADGARKVRDLFSRLSHCRLLPYDTRATLTNKAAQVGLGLPYLERRDSLLAEREAKRVYRTRLKELAERDAQKAANRIAWLAGENVRVDTFDAPSGGPALRVYADELQTSWGASVPLAHAIKAFRFVKLCKESGRTFARNGKTIRVGHFQVDKIESTGDFIAGCHSFKWSEIARVAKIAGVFDMSADDSAIQESI